MCVCVTQNIDIEHNGVMEVVAYGINKLAENVSWPSEKL